MNVKGEAMDVKNADYHDIPVVISKTVTSGGISLLALWKILGDSSYQVRWPEDRKRPLVPYSIILVYSKNGHGKILLKSGKVIDMQGHCVIFLDPMDVESYGCEGELWDLNLIEFQPNGCFDMSYNQVFHLNEQEYFFNEFESLVGHLENNNNLSQSLGVAILTKVIYQWVVLMAHKQKSIAQGKVEAVVEAMHRELSEKWTLEKMALVAECSPSYLREIFVKYTKQSPKQYYLNMRLNIALAKLSHGKARSVKALAFELNFYDAYHFSKAFKAKFGLPPSSLIRE